MAIQMIHHIIRSISLSPKARLLISVFDLYIILDIHSRRFDPIGVRYIPRSFPWNIQRMLRFSISSRKIMMRSKRNTLKTFSNKEESWDILRMGFRTKQSGTSIRRNILQVDSLPRNAV